MSVVGPSRPLGITTNPYAAPTTSGGANGRGSGTRLLKRLFKFPQMDFELALWEITTIMVGPKKVFKNMYYNVSRTFAPNTTTAWRRN